MAFAMDRYYAAMADAIERGPQTYGGDAGIASLRCFRRYTRDSHYDLPDAFGGTRWVSAKQLRVYGIIARIAMTPTGRARMSDIAAEARVCPATVSRTVLRLQAWGLFAVDVRRGRGGGITVWRAEGTRFAAYAIAARQRLAAVAKATALKLSSRIQRLRDAGQWVLLAMDETFNPEYAYLVDRQALKARLAEGNEAYRIASARPLSPFTAAVLRERLRLAAEDPAGEADAVAPLWGYTR